MIYHINYRSYATKGCIIVCEYKYRHVQLNSGGKDVTKYIGYNATVYYKTEADQDILAYIVPNSKTKEITFNNLMLISIQMVRHTGIMRMGEKDSLYRK